MDKVRIFKKVTIIFVMLIICYFSSKAQKTVELTYIANSGFLIKGESGKLFIDGLFDEDYGQFHKPTSEIISSAVNGESPFDNISHILISHKDKDHFTSSYTMEQMLSNSNAYLISTNQVKGLLQSYGSFSSVSDRTFFTKPDNGEKIDSVINNLQFKIMFLQHGEDPDFKKENLGVLFNIDGIKFFHMGDANQNNLNEFETLDLANENIDIAFFPYWIYESSAGRKIIEYINAKAVVLMHVQLSRLSKYKSLESTYENLPPVFFYDTVLTKSTVNLYPDDSISIEGANQIKFTEPTFTKLTKENEYTVYPNPASNYLNVSSSTRLAGSTIEIFNITGETVFTGIMEYQNITIDINNCKPGAYFLKINNSVNKIMIR